MMKSTERLNYRELWHVPGSDLSARLGLLDHARRRPILDRTGGVIALQLAENDVGGLARQTL